MSFRKFVINRRYFRFRVRGVNFRGNFVVKDLFLKGSGSSCRRRYRKYFIVSN